MRIVPAYLRDVCERRLRVDDVLEDLAGFIGATRRHDGLGPSSQCASDGGDVDWGDTANDHDGELLRRPYRADAAEAVTSGRDSAFDGARGFSRDRPSHSTQISCFHSNLHPLNGFARRFMASAASEDHQLS